LQGAIFHHGSVARKLRRAPLERPRNHGDGEQDQENHKQNLRNTGRGAGDTAKPENTGDNRDNKEY
jgi:hypothetical protein